MSCHFLYFSVAPGKQTFMYKMAIAWGVDKRYGLIGKNGTAMPPLCHKVNNTFQLSRQSVNFFQKSPTALSFKIALQSQ